MWDFPGGHVESGESPESALRRELREELDIDIEIPGSTPDHRVVSGQLDMRLWILYRWSGTPTNSAPNEHELIAWFTLADARNLVLAQESYLAIVEQVLAH